VTLRRILGGSNRLQVSTVPDVQTIRARLNRMLDKAKRAADMPWDARLARSYEHAFPQQIGCQPRKRMRSALRSVMRFIV
jgi:hypothetical protein